MTLLERLQHFLEHIRELPADRWGEYEIEEWVLLRELVCQYVPPDASGDARGTADQPGIIGTQASSQGQPLKIKRWIETGEFGVPLPRNTAKLLHDAGELLEIAHANDITGPCLFLGEDKRFYTGSVVFRYGAADPEYVRGMLQPYSGVELSRRLTNKLLALLPPATEGDSHSPQMSG